jgi:cellobiose epimerase
MSVSRKEVEAFRDQVAAEWRTNIAPFWVRYGPDATYGGFRGLITTDLQVDEGADKGVILNSRVLWTFARATRLYGDTAFRQLADRAYDYLARHFVDSELGGVYWTVDYRGRPSDTKKRTYAQAFALYGLTEYYAATREQGALDAAFDLFDVLETRCRDGENDGFFETFERDWSLAGDQRLSEVDQDVSKSMNAHLHVLEAYATLARATMDGRVVSRLRDVVELFLSHVVDADGARLRMFFDERWNVTSNVDSFGHDIEASWLLYEAAEVLHDEALLARVRAVALPMAQAVHDRALAKDGGIVYEAERGAISDDERHWWVQAEGVVGFLNAFQLGGGEHFLAAAIRIWKYIADRIVDGERGEWYWKVSSDGNPSTEMPKVSQWKCPYHNGRMCFEVARRLGASKESPLYGSQGV